MSARPLYLDVYEQILQAIRTGKYHENMPLPPERTMCEAYHVSRFTIRQALAMLKENGVVYSVHGMGTFVKPRVYTQPLSGFYSFTDTLKNDHVLMENRIVQYELRPASPALQEKTGCPAGEIFHELVRLRSAQTYPLMLETTYLPRSRFLTLDLDVLAQESLYAYLRTRYRFTADRATETLRPILASSAERELLQIPTTIPCMLLERCTYENDMVIEYTRSVVRGDKYIFRIDLPSRNL